MKSILKASIPITAIFLLISLNADCQGFPLSHTEWGTPEGGFVGEDSHESGFIKTASGSISYSGCNGWSTIDMNGDGLADLVLTSEGDGDYADSFDIDSDPHWKVYLNTGSGFSSAAINWTLPEGGYTGSLDDHFYGFSTLARSGASTLGTQGWATTDINGDNMPDLVVVSEGDGQFSDVFGFGTNTYWKAHLNTGSGFSTTELNWTLPVGGRVSFNGHVSGFDRLSYSGSFWGGCSSDGCNLWSTMDMNNDGKMDLVVTAEGNDDYSLGFDVDTNPHWKVYLNTGSGFSLTVTNWDLPEGGFLTIDGDELGIWKTEEPGLDWSEGSNAWTTTDMNGDGIPDLVKTALIDNGYIDSFNVGDNPHWKVHLGSGSGFSSTATNWTLPSGGYIEGNNHESGFLRISEAGEFFENCNGWSTSDLNGDGRPDLIVTSEGDGTFKNSFDVGFNPYWKMYPNTGSGFSTNATNWVVPVGGYVDEFDHESGYWGMGETGDPYDDCNAWSTIDIDGDGKLDFVVTAEGDGTHKDSFAVNNNPYWKVYLNTSIIAVSELDRADISIYPTLVEDFLNFEFDKTLELFDVTVYDALGKQVLAKVGLNTSTQLNLSGLESGVYVVSVKAEEFEVVDRVVKN